MYETLKFTEMTTRRVIDAKDKDGEKVYVKGHAKATYMSDGRTVEDAIKQIGTGGGGGGGITVETDPVFSASPAASITEGKKTEWDNKYTKPSGGIPKSDLASDVQTSLGNADNAVQKGMVGTFNIIEVEGVYDGDYVYALPTAAAKNVDEDYDDIILSRGSVKTINGKSIFGSGDITISGGSGEVGPQGPQGDKGDTGVGVASVAQTTTSNADGGSNVVTVTLTNGTKSTFTVKNGSKGSQGIQGEQGPKGDKGDTGANGTNGTNGKDGADGEDGATFTPSVDSAGNLSWSNNKGLANPPTVNIKGPKGDAGEGGGGSSGGEGVIQWTTRYAPDYINEDGVINLDPFVVYYGGFFPSDGTIYLNSNADYNEWRIIFYIYPNCSLNFEVDEWVNGITPDISKGGHYELSVVENEDVHLGIMAHFSEE